MKDTHLQIRLSKDEKESIQKWAQATHMDMSAWVLSKIFPDVKKQYLNLMWQLKEKENEKSYLLNEFNSFLQGLTPKDLSALEDHKVALSSFVANYVAAMIEYACINKSAKVPEWVLLCEGLEEPYFASNMPSLRLYLLTHAPLPFKRRNIYIDSSVGDLV